VHQEDADNVDGPVGCAEAQLSWSTSRRTRNCHRPWLPHSSRLHCQEDAAPYKGRGRVRHQK